MTRKWASCSTLGWIRLAEDLADQPDDFHDYVIVNELLRLQIPTHGKLFKSLMSIYIPNWRDLELPGSRGELVSRVTRHVGQHARDSAQVRDRVLLPFLPTRQASRLPSFASPFPGGPLQ